MEILSQYKSSKNNEALLMLVKKSFPDNENLQNDFYDFSLSENHAHVKISTLENDATLSIQFS